MLRSENRRQHGVALVYMAVMLIVLLGFISLAVDYGQVQLAKMELRNAADASARAGAYELLMGSNDTTVRNVAGTWASYNKANGGQSVVLQNNGQGNDVQIGNWDTTVTPHFSVGSGNKNAVQVTAHLANSRSSAVSLMFGKIIGRPTCDISAVSVACLNVSGIGMIGLNYVKMSGNTSSSYWGSSANASQYGNIESNGSITLGNSCLIQGNARPGIGQTVNGSGVVTGSTAPLTYVLSYPNGDAGTYATTNDNGLLPNSVTTNGKDLNIGKNVTVSVPGGNYYFRNFDMGSGADLAFSGPTTIYVYGTFNMSGHASVPTSKPGDLNIVMVPNGGTPPGSLNITSGSTLYAQIYAPQSDITFGGNGDIYGWVVGLSITMTGNADVHYDLAGNNQNGIAIVQ